MRRLARFHARRASQTAVAASCGALIPRFGRSTMIKRTCCCCAILLLLLSHNRAEAHPHVWVTFHSEVLYAGDGSVTGVRHVWTFDDMFSAYALQGISHAQKGQYSQKEFAPVAQTQSTSL